MKSKREVGYVPFKTGQLGALRRARSKLGASALSRALRVSPSVIYKWCDGGNSSGPNRLFTLTWLSANGYFTEGEDVRHDVSSNTISTAIKIAVGKMGANKFATAIGFSEKAIRIWLSGGGIHNKNYDKVVKYLTEQGFITLAQEQEQTQEQPKKDVQVVTQPSNRSIVKVQNKTLDKPTWARFKLPAGKIVNAVLNSSDEDDAVRNVESLLLELRNEVKQELTEVINKAL